jgi:general secretion pathway protein C
MRTSLLLGVALALGACGGSAAATSSRAPLAASSAPAGPAVAPPAPAEGAGDHSLKRSTVRAAVSQGLGPLLHHIELDDQPVRAEGKFHGFRVAALRDPDFWSGVDLKPGDVVTSVNGFPIEHPEQLQAAFDSLRVASELRVTYERDGKSRELVYPIVDDR